MAATQFIPMFTIQSELEMLEGEYSDAFKAAHGFRPRGMGMPETVEGLRSEISALYDIARREYEESLAYQAVREREFEQRISEVIDMGAGDRTTALRWMLQEDYSGDYWFDVEGWLYLNGFSHRTTYAKGLRVEIDTLLPTLLEHAKGV